MRNNIVLAALLLVSGGLSAQQLPNGGFESGWQGCNPWVAGSAGKETGQTPSPWCIAQVAGMGGMGATVVGWKDTGRSGNCVRLQNVANSVMSTQIVPGYMVLGTSWNTSVMGKKNDGGCFGGQAFTYRPDALNFYYKFSKGCTNFFSVVAYTWKGSVTQKGVPCNIVAFGDPQTKDLVDRERCILGIATTYGGTVTKSSDFALVSLLNEQVSQEATDWTEKTIDLEYRTTDAPAKINVIFAQSDYFAQPTAAGGVLYIDDVSLVYYHEFTALKYDGQTLPLTGGTINLTAPFDASKLSWTLRGASQSAQVTHSVSGKTLTLTVTAQDGGASTYTYTLKNCVTGVTLDATTWTPTRIGDTKQLTATVAPSTADDKSVRWSSSNASVAQVSNTGLVTFRGDGEATITVTTVDQAKTATCKVSYTRPAQTLTWPGEPKGNTLDMLTTLNLDAATDAKLPLTYKLDGNPVTASAITFDGVTYKSGQHTLVIEQAGDDAHKPLSKTVTFQVNKLKQTITWPGCPGAVGLDMLTALPLDAVSDRDGQTVTYKLDGASLNAESVTFDASTEALKSGDHTMTLALGAPAAEEIYTNATLVVPFQVNKLSQTLTWPELPGSLPMNDLLTFAATAAPNAQAVLTYQLAKEGVDETRSVAAGTAYAFDGSDELRRKGNYSIVVSQRGGDVYLPATETFTFEVGRMANQVTWEVAKSSTVGGSVALNATALGGTFTYSLNGQPLPAGTTEYTFEATGTYRFEAFTEGDEMYGPKKETRSVLVKQLQQELAWSPATTLYVNETITLNATNTATQYAPVYTLAQQPDGSAPFDATAGTYVPNKMGLYVIEVNAPAQGGFGAAQTLRKTFNVKQREQTITGFDTRDVNETVPYTVALGAAASSQLPVVYKLDGVLQTGAEIEFTTAGTHILTCEQPGNDEWAPAAKKTRNITVSQVQQRITLKALNKEYYVGEAIDLSATVAPAGRELTYKLNNVTVTPGVHTDLEANAYHFVVSNAGDATYLPAEAFADFVVKRNEQKVLWDPTAALGEDVNNAGAYVLMEDAVLPLNAQLSKQGEQTVEYYRDGVKIEPDAEGNFTLSTTDGRDEPYVFQAKALANNAWEAAESPIYKVLLPAQNGERQTITWEGVSLSAHIGDIVTLNATASSGLPVSYRLNGEEITGSTYAITAAGTYEFVAQQEGGEKDGTTYNRAASLRKSVACTKADQHLTWVVTEGIVAPGTEIPLAATSDNADPKANPVKYSLNGAEYRLSTLTCDKVGTYVVCATQAADGSHYAAEPLTRSFTVLRAAQSLAWDDCPTTAAVGQQITLGATTDNGLTQPVYSVGGQAGWNGYCDQAGTLTVVVSQPGNDDYLPAEPIIRAIEVARGTQNVSGTQGIKATAGVPVELPVIATLQNVQFKLTDTGEPLAVVGGKVTFDQPGVVSVTAYNAGNVNYEPLSEAFTVTVDKAPQTIAWDQHPNTLAVHDKIMLTATASSGLPITYDANPAFITLTTDASGMTWAEVIQVPTGYTTSITANQAGNDHYLAAAEATMQVSMNAVLKPTPLPEQRGQNITWELPETAYVGDVVALTGTTTSGLPIQYSVTSGSATFGLNTVRFDAAGTYTVSAAQPGNALWTAAAPEQRTIVVSKRGQALTFTATPLSAAIGETVRLAVSSTSGLPVTITDGDGNEYGDLARFAAEGTVTLTARQDGNGAYNAATDVELTITVGKTAQSISLSAEVIEVAADEPIYFSAAATSGLPVTVTDEDGNVVTSGVKSYEEPGIHTWTVTQDGNDLYAAAQSKTLRIAVAQQTQTIDLTASATRVYVGDNVSFTALSSAGLPVKLYDASDQAFRSNLTFSQSGEQTITARAEAQGAYGPASKSVAITVSKRPQTVSLTASRQAALIGEPITFRTSSTSGYDCKLYTADGTEVDTRGSWTAQEAGTYSFVAKQAGNDAWANAESQTVKVTLSSMPQTITFEASSTELFVGEKVTFTAQASSGLPVTIKDHNGDKLTSGYRSFPAEGTYVFTAQQPGQAPYNAAPDQKVTITVSKHKQTVTLHAGATELYVGESVALQASSTLGQPVDIVNAAGDKVSSIFAPTKAGKYTFRAQASATANYGAAESEPLDITVSKRTPELTFYLDQDHILVGESVEVYAASTSLLPVTVSIAGVELQQSTKRFDEAGTYVIHAEQAATDAWEGVSDDLFLTVGAKKSTIDVQVNGVDWRQAPEVKVGEPLDLSVLNSATIEDPTAPQAVITDEDGNVVSGTITFDRPGSYRYHVSIPETDYWQGYEDNIVVVVGRKNQTVTWNMAKTSYTIGETFELRATCDSGDPITFATSDGQALSGPQTYDRVQTLLIYASVAQSDAYNAAKSDVLTLTIVKKEEAGSGTTDKPDDPGQGGTTQPSEGEGGSTQPGEKAIVLPTCETVPVKIFTANGTLVVEGSDGRPVTVYDLAGRVVWRGGDTRLPLQRGLYLVQVGNDKAVKVRN